MRRFLIISLAIFLAFPIWAEADYTIVTGEKSYRDRYGNEHRLRKPSWVYPCHMNSGQLKLEKSSSAWIKNCVGPYIRPSLGDPLPKKPSGVVYENISCRNKNIAQPIGSNVPNKIRSVGGKINRAIECSLGFDE